MACCKGTDKSESHAEMMRMSISEIAQAVHGVVNVDNAYECDQVFAIATCSDSREVYEGSLFVAFRGERVDGHDYVNKAAKSGAVAAIVEHVVPDVDPNFAQIVVEDSVKALGLLAKHNIESRRECDSEFSIVGVTGSVGKTTTKDMLHALLSTLGETVAPVGSFNNEIGLPLTALRVGENTRFLVAEMGANHVGEIAYLTNIAPPDIAIVLKVGVAHLGEFGSVEKIAQAKSEIVQGLVPHGVAVLNADDSRVAAMQSLADEDKIRWFGIKNKKSQYCIIAENVNLDEYGCASAVFKEFNAGESGVSESESSESGVSESKSHESSQNIHLSIQGEHNIMNALAAANVARYFGMQWCSIASVLKNISHISPHRMQISTVCKNNQSFTLIDDSFNANPDSMKAGINGLCAYENSCNHDTEIFRIAVLGSMLELGKDENILHENIGEYAIEHNLDAVIAVGSNTSKDLDNLAKYIYEGAKKACDNLPENSSKAEVFYAHNVREADETVWSLVAQHSRSVVLLKGSHASGLSALAEKWDSLQSLPEKTKVEDCKACEQMEVKR